MIDYLCSGCANKYTDADDALNHERLHPTHISYPFWEVEAA